MSKRMTDTDVWKKSWFYDLEPKYKLFWFYILSDCDASGVWAVNLKLAENILRVKIDASKLLDVFKGQIISLNGGSYWIIQDFIKFQYGYPLSDNSPMRRKLNSLLEVRGLSLDTLYNSNLIEINKNTYPIDRVSIGYSYPIDTLKDKDKDKDKDNRGGVGEKNTPSPEEENWRAVIQHNYPKLFQMRTPLEYSHHTKLVTKYGKKEVARIYERMQNWPELIKKRESAYLTAKNFLRTDNPSL